MSLQRLGLTERIYRRSDRNKARAGTQVVSDPCSVLPGNRKRSRTRQLFAARFGARAQYTRGTETVVNWITSRRRSPADYDGSRATSRVEEACVASRLLEDVYDRRSVCGDSDMSMTSVRSSAAIEGVVCTTSGTRTPGGRFRGWSCRPT